MSIREEFRLKKVGFSGVSRERFYISQWNMPGVFYLLFRVILSLYTLIMLGSTAGAHIHNKTTHPWAIYLTNWTYTTLTLYFFVHALVVIGGYLVCRGEQRSLMNRMESDAHAELFNETSSNSNNEGESGDSPTESQPLLHVEFTDGGSSQSLPWYLKIVWILFNIASTSSIMVTLVFWAVLVPLARGSGLAAVNYENVQLHLINTVLVLLDQSVTAVPVRLLHFLFPFIYGLIYMLFSVIYWAVDHSHIIYEILDWGKPWITTGCVLVIGFVIVPGLHFVLYLLYRLRMKLYNHLDR